MRKENKIPLLKKIYSLLPEGDLRKLVLLILMMLTASLLELVGVGLIPVFVAILAQPDVVLEVPELARFWEMVDVHNFETLFFFGVGALAVIFILKNIYITIYHYVEGRYIWNRYNYISGNLFKRYMNAPYTFYLNRNSSTILRNVTEEGRFLASQVLAPMLKLMMNVLVITGILILLLVTEPIISIVAFGIIGGVGGLFVFLLRNKLSGIGERANTSRVEMIKSVNEGIGGIKDIRVLRREPWFVNRFLTQLKGYVDSQTYFSAVVHSNKPVTETVAVIGMLVITVGLYLQGNSVESMITTMTLFGAATIRILPAMREVMRDTNSLRYYSYSAGPIHEDFHALGKVDEMIDTGIQEKDYEGSVNFPRLGNEIIFSGVSFSYPGTQIQAVSNLNFTINKGDVVGLAGATGAGKTTVVDLMLGLLEPQQGIITFDGVELDKFMKGRNDTVGYVPQFIFLTDDTLKRNIALGLRDDEIDPEQLDEAIEKAQLQDVVEGLTDGLETVIGERGVRLSGGQRQRIGIARALYHDPDVIIMDEATSALDSHTENEIVDAIERLRGNRTMIMITHRISTLEHCDMIWFMENGQITDSGTLESLTQQNLSFQKMSQTTNT